MMRLSFYVYDLNCFRADDKAHGFMRSVLAKEVIS